MPLHTKQMLPALDLAKKGWPQVVPNPLVGCVIVQNDEVLASGFHEKYGLAHAEVNAINNLPEDINVSDCVLYVTLEPCSHHGKTPPCADLLIKRGFKKVVVACSDPNPEVAGKGIARLRAAGLEVIVGVCEKEARFLNRRFFCFHEKLRPYVILKWAQTADGFISRIPVPLKREENWISGPESQTLVHNLRAEVQGIMVGKNTVLLDNPRLTTRLVKGHNPTRIFIDRDLDVPREHNIYNPEAHTIVFNRLKKGQERNINFVQLSFEGNILPQVLEQLHRFNIQSLLVEGGSHLIQHFMDQEYWDEALVIENPFLNFETGVKAPPLPADGTNESLGKDKLFRYFREQKNREINTMQKR